MPTGRWASWGRLPQCRRGAVRLAPRHLPAADGTLCRGLHRRGQLPEGEHPDRSAAGGFSIDVGGARLAVAGFDGLQPGGEAELLLRPEALALVPADSGQAAHFTGTISKLAFLAASQHCQVAIAGGGALKLAIPPNRAVAPGEAVGIAVALDQAWLMPEITP